MKQTIIRERMRVELREPLLIEGFPGLGNVGKIAVSYLVKQLQATFFAELYSPHFPYHVLVNDDGEVRLLRGELYFWRNSDPKGGDLILLTGDSQAHTLEGQYEVASTILSYVRGCGVKRLIAIGGYEALSKEEPKVIAAATEPSLLEEFVGLGAVVGEAGNPIVGMAGILLGLTGFYGINGVCLLAETPGYIPDPRAARSILKILRKILGNEISLQALDEEIVKAREALGRVEEIEKKIETLEKTTVKAGEGKVTYIS